MSPLIFDEDSHTYTVNGQELPSVSTIARRFFPPMWQSEAVDRALMIGNATHEAIEFGLLNEDGVFRYTNLTYQVALGYAAAEASVAEHFDAVHARIAAFCKWYEGQRSIEILQCERPHYHETLGFAGTPDLVFRIDSWRWVIDHKTGVSMPWHPLQTAGYALLLKENENWPIVRRGALYLQSDGTFALKEHTDPLDYTAFVAALNLGRYIDGQKG